MTRLLIRLAQWWRNPPSPRMLAIIAVAVTASLGVVLVETLFGWPDWLTTEPVPVRRM